MGDCTMRARAWHGLRAAIFLTAILAHFHSEGAAAEGVQHIESSMFERYWISTFKRDLQHESKTMHACPHLQS